jgi:hypothetical protein
MSAEERYPASRRHATDLAEAYEASKRREAAEAYQAGRIKRVRATKSEMSTRRRRIREIVEQDQPMTVRQVFYQAVVHGIVGKTDDDYAKVQDLLADLRRSGEVPYEYIVDEGRYARRPYTVEGIPEALNNTRHNYRKDPWQETPEYVQIWVEKNALIGVLEPVTREYDVSLMVAVGYSSISFLHEAAVDLTYLSHPVFVYQLGDLDPSGAQAAEAIEKDLRGFAPEAEIYFQRIAITPQQITDFGLQAALRPTKRSDPRYRWFREQYRDVAVLQGGQLSCELDAIRPNDLRKLVQETIEQHLPRERLDVMNARGEQEKVKIGRMLDRYLDELGEPEPITVCRNGGPANGHWMEEYLAPREEPRSERWSDFGSEHAEALYHPSRVNDAGQVPAAEPAVPTQLDLFGEGGL